MNILFLMILSPNFDSPDLYTELIEEFRDKGNNVFVASIDEKRNGRNTRIEETNGIQILHVKTGNLFGVNPVEKGLTTLSLEGKFKLAINKYFSDVRFDLVIMPTPPITFAGVVAFIKNRDSAKSYLILRDIFPQNAVDIGLMSPGFIYKFFRKKEKYMYQVSDYIGCMSQGNIEYVIKHNPEVEKSKLHILPNWGRNRIDASRMPHPTGYLGLDTDVVGGTEAFHPTENFGLDLKDKFVCLFGGNIGWPQELSFLLDLAESVRDYKDIVFFIVGKGVLKSKLEKEISDRALSNVILKDSLPKADYDELVTRCDVGLINLDRRFTIPNIPSKTVGYFKAGIPILASVDANTDYGKILEESGAGLWSVTGNLKDYKNNLLFYYENPEEKKKMGENGKAYFEKYLTVDIAYNTIMQRVT